MFPFVFMSLPPRERELKLFASPGLGEAEGSLPPRERELKPLLG